MRPPPGSVSGYFSFTRSYQANSVNVTDDHRKNSQFAAARIGLIRPRTFSGTATQVYAGTATCGEPGASKRVKPLKSGAHRQLCRSSVAATTSRVFENGNDRAGNAGRFAR